MRSSRSQNVSRSISPSSVPSCRSIAASSIGFVPRGRRIFGPPRAAAQLECSKAFAKGFMARHGIPTARYRVCDSSAEARAAIDVAANSVSRRVEGRRARRGQGRRGRADRAEARDAIRAAMDDRQFGDAGARLVIEECLTGPEVSFFALCDGTRALPLARRRITSASSTATADRTPEAWARSRRAR